MFRNFVMGASQARAVANRPAATFLLASSQRSVMGSIPQRQFRQVNNLHEIVYTAQAELAQRTEKYLERTDRVYKPSQTIEFNREGELLIYSCDNIKHSTIYFKYPYCMYDCLMPLSWYIFFVNPLMWSW